MRLSAHGERRGMRLTQATLTPAARLDHIRFAMSFDVDTAPLGALAFGELKSGLVRHTSDRSDRYYRRGQVYLAAQPGHHYTAAVEDVEAETVVIDPDLPSQLAGTAPGRAQQPVRFTGYEPVSPGAARQWRAT
jgi:hypothetical protein